MKRHLCQIFLVAAATCSAPVAFADSIIVKCIDGAGRVTLTDQPCEPGVSTVRVSSAPSSEGVTPVRAHPLAAEQATLPPAHELQRRALSARSMATPVAKPMTGDVATLKAARAQFLMSDVGAHPTLAVLD